MSLRVLGLEALDGGSHRSVRESITRHSRHAWTWIVRPARGWKWRQRLAAHEMLDEAATRGLLDPAPDAVFASSPIAVADVAAALRRRPECARCALVAYVHENQAAYPAGVTPSRTAARDVQPALTDLASVRAADLTIWSSAWNRRSCASALRELLRHAPERRAASLVDGLETLGAVAWPPVEPPPPDLPPRAPALHKPTRVLWPHRWEHDKDPGAFVALADRHAVALDLRFVLLGGRGRSPHPALDDFRARHGDRIDHDGHLADRAAYWRLVASCDWVVSTARHEFFGIGVAEALLAGCLPWLPNRLSYPELVPAGIDLEVLGPDRPPADPEPVRAAIRTHLADATAPRAVARLDALIAETVHDRGAAVAAVAPSAPKPAAPEPRPGRSGPRTP